MSARWLISGFLLLVTQASFSQIFREIVPNKSHREGSNFSVPCPTPPLCDYHDMVSWNDSQIKQLTYRGHQGSLAGPVVEFMNFRIVFPLNYDSNRVEKYPMIVMLHGAGESGRLWSGQYNYATTDARFDNNGSNIIHGGQAHLNAVNRNPDLSNSFPGIVLWAQASYNGAWESGWENGVLSQNGRMVSSTIEWMLETMNVDPNRIYMHGLSNGAKGTWDLASKRPDLFAAILPMAGVGSNNTAMAAVLNTTPLWLFQGGTDTNPRPQAAVDAIAALQAAGGDPRYTLYPTLGHGVWNTAYAEADFFPWIKSKTKKDIYVFGGDPNICPGGSLQLGFSHNMLAYQWKKDGVDIPGATTRFYSASTTGVYTVRYRRRITPQNETDWTESNPVTVGNKAASTFVPLLTNTGSTNLRVDLSGVDNRITFTAPTGYPEYYWFKGATQVASGTSNTRQISSGQGGSTDAGLYTVKVLEATGCISASSNAITVNWVDPQPTSPRPAQPTITPISSTEVNLTWPDYSGEIGYELWRVRFSNSNPAYNFQDWRLIKLLDAGITTFKDSGLRPEAQYDYLIRALLPGGQAIFSSVGAEWPFAFTLPDNIPPTTPLNLIASNITDTQATLTWDPSTDNDIVYKYEVYNGSTKLTEVIGNVEGNPTPATTINLTGLVTGMTYLLSVRAVDYRNNYSPFAESITINTLSPQNGLSYKYYHFTGNMPGPAGQQLNETTPQTPASFNFNQTPVATGTVSTFSIAPRQQNDNFVFAFDGFIEVLNTGNHTFFTTSDDGSRLYINGTLVVNNDGAHGPVEVSGIYNFTTTGKFPIRVTFFEQGGGETLEVRWQKSTGSGQFSKQLIPSNRLYLTGATITNYYSKATGDLNNIASWGTNADGSGLAPSNFTTSLTYFNIRNRTNVDVISDWTVSGTGSKVIIGNGVNPVTMNFNAAVNALVESNNNTTLTLNHATLPSFGLMHSGSNVIFNVPGTVTVPNALYGNVTLANASASQYNWSLNNTVIQGNLTIDNGTLTSGASVNLSTLRIGGNLVINNTSGNPFPATGANQYALVFTGGTNHIISFTNPVALNLFSIQTDFGDQVSFNNLTSNLITLGSNQGGGLILKGGSSLNIGNNNLTVTGRGTINANNETGALSMNGGNFAFTSTAAQNNNIYFAAGSAVNNLTSTVPTNNRSSILTAVQVSNLVTVGGELNAGEGYLTLKSTSDGPGGTARIGPLLNGSKVSGKITMERYMSGEGRIYRYISSPVRNVTAADLQVFFPITGNFTGASTGPGITTANASMFQYAEPTYTQFPAVGGTNLDTLRRGKGYSPFIREASAATTWKVTGEPYQGNITFTLTNNPSGASGSGWNLLGNPYPAPIKWTGSNTGGWTMSGVNEVVYVRENTAPGVYIWRHFNGSTGTFDGVIAPGQAFWVRTTTASPQLIIGENAKHSSDGTFFREGWPTNTLEVVMKNGALQDAAYIQWRDGANESFDTDMDGVKQDNSGFNISTLTTNQEPLAINLTTTNYCEQDIRLRITNAPVGSYQLSLYGVESLISQDEVILIDNFTQTQKTVVDDEVYAFSITSDPASKADGRFVLRFKKPEVVLNQTLKSVAACEQDSPIIKIENSQPGVTYQAFVNGTAVSANLTSTGGTLELPISTNQILFGEIVTQIKAGFKGCNSYDLPMTIAVVRDTLPLPIILAEPTQLTASTEDATYQWYLNGEAMEGQTGRELLAPEEGWYQVEVSKGACQKISDTLDYVVTGIEKPNRLQRLYPNPTRERVIVEMEQSIDFESVQVITTVGQIIQVPTVRLSAESAEVDLSSLPTGLYLIQVNRERYRVLKE